LVQKKREEKRFVLRILETAAPMWTIGCSVGPKNTVLWDAFTAVSIRDAAWDFVPCGQYFINDTSWIEQVIYHLKAE
jgi:hypothetical protein